MGIATVTSASILVGGFDASAFTGTISTTPGEVTTFDATTFGSNGFVQQAVGHKKGSLGLEGFADYATGANAQSLVEGTQYAYTVAIPGTAAADPCVLGRGIVTSVRLGMEPGQANPFGLTAVTDSAFAFGKIAAPLASRTTSGLTGTAVAMTGPTASQSLYATLHVTAAAGTNLAVKIQSDDNANFTSATDRITFSTVSATGWQFKSVAGDLSTETYWRAVATIGTSTFSFAVAIGVV